MLYRQQYYEGSKKKDGDEWGDINYDAIESVMLGELGYREWELHKTTWKGVQLAIKGLRDKDEYTASIARRLAAAVVGAGMNDKLKRNFEKFWPVAKGTKRGIPQAAIDQLRRFKVQEEANKLKNG